MTRTRFGIPLLFTGAAVRCLCAIAVTALSAESSGRPALDEDQLRTDLAVLTSSPHRLPGSDASHRAVEHLRNRLQEIGVQTVLDLDMPVWSYEAGTCELHVGNRTIPLSPMRPNLIVPPATPKGGTQGPLLYVGAGTLEDYGDRSPDGAIVLLEYEHARNWQHAFRMGAKAVVFIGDGDETPSDTGHVPVPTNFVRAYAQRAAFEGFDLESLEGDATLVAHPHWRHTYVPNIIARIPGVSGANGSSDETVVLAAEYDTYGAVPHRAAGARRAANVSALLQLAEHFARNPPPRNIVVMFLGNRAFNHQGAREVYNALHMPANQHATLTEEHEAETEAVENMRALLERKGLKYEGDEAGADHLHSLLRSEVDFLRDDVASNLQSLRLHMYKEGAHTEELEARENELTEHRLLIDQIRRAIHGRDLLPFVAMQEEYAEGVFTSADSEEWNEKERAEMRLKARDRMLPLFATIREQIRSRLDQRARELARLQLLDNQRSDLRHALLPEDQLAEDRNVNPGILAHLVLDISDNGPKWGVYVGDDRHKLLDSERGESADQPGFYSRFLSVCRDVAGNIPNGGLLHPRTLRDPLFGDTFVAGRYTSSGNVAGGYGVYHAALTTGFDARRRDGYPADTPEALNLEAMLPQFNSCFGFLDRLAGTPALTMPPLFTTKMTSKYRGWTGGRSHGDFAALSVIGGLAETRPAAGAMLAQWPAPTLGTAFWNHLNKAGQMPDFCPVSLERVSSVGRFRTLGIRTDYSTHVGLVGALFERTGRLSAITNQATVSGKIASSIRIDLISCVSYNMIHPAVHDAFPGSLSLLEATSDALFMDKRYMWGSHERIIFGHFSNRGVSKGLKVFQPLGPVVLGEINEQSPSGTGIDLRANLGSPVVSRYTHDNLWNLNESRLRNLRSRGITRPDLEVLHGEALAAARQAETDPDLAQSEASRLASASLSHRLYGPLRSSLDDLVHAIVMLLLLAIPFAFAMERLLICAKSIYGRIGGFVLMFAITFGILFWLHPGFAISSAPMLIFLAFAILLLSSLVIFIVVRKFNVELKALQGQSVGSHAVEVSRMGTMMAAVGMGMSTMRRRPTRTLLTAITVVALTFTILCFASFTQEVGVHAVYEGPTSERMPSSVLIHQLDFSQLPEDLSATLGSKDSQSLDYVGEQWWLVRQKSNAPYFSVAHPATGEAVTVDAVLGLQAGEIRHWPALGNTLNAGGENPAEAIARNAVFLPRIVLDSLGLAVGDTVLLEGREAVVGGTINGGRMQRLRNIDGRPVIPVNFAEETAIGGGAESHHWRQTQHRACTFQR